jgi:hypothetical protein
MTSEESAAFSELSSDTQKLQQNMQELVFLLNQLNNDPLFKLYCYWQDFLTWLNSIFEGLGEWFDEMLC